MIPLILTGAWYTSAAQNNKYQFSHLDIGDGLSHNQVNCIYSDSKGFIWFGTMSGLNRYNGYTFKVFKHNNNDKYSVNDDYIVNIFEGPGGKMWVETRNGLCIYDPATEQFNNKVSLVLRSLKLRDTIISEIKKDTHGNYWFIYGNSGIYNMTHRQKKLTITAVVRAHYQSYIQTIRLILARIVKAICGLCIIRAIWRC